MDNKKQQNFSRTSNAKSTYASNDFNRQKTSSSSSDLQANKQWPRNSRRRENPLSNTRNSYNGNSKSFAQNKARPNVDKRPRPRGYYGNNGENGSYRGANRDCVATGARLATEDDPSDDLALGAVGQYDHDLNSVYSSGSKKHNLNHLLNFYYTPRVLDYPNDVPRSDYSKRPKYNKEQFLQANFQFVIKATAKRKTDASPDALIDWSLIEQINIQTPEQTQCPICLYPPVAGKITRCGHVYCWPCILHYLSLSDKTWRKCPICYESIHMGDLKSAAIMQQKTFNVGSDITFQLMRRKKGSFYIEKHAGTILNQNVVEKYPYMSGPEEEKNFSKFLLAKRADVAGILAREQQELLSNIDESCPENVFIQQALLLLQERNQPNVKADEMGERSDNSDEMNNMDGKDLTHALDCATDEQPSNEETNTKCEELTKISSSEEEHNLEYSATGCSTTTTTAAAAKYYYFYQSEDGQNIYLHPLNVKMLQAAYGSLATAPPSLKGRILQKECHSMDEEHRRKFTCLGHLPLTCEFSVVEIELLPPYITEDILHSFRADIMFRKQERQRRAREERERAKKIDAINDRQMGKLVASTANINLNSVQEFPTCGFEEALPSGTGNVESDNNVTSLPLRRTKTLSNSSTGSCSYSAIALHCQQEQSAWTTVNAAKLQQQTVTTEEEEGEEGAAASTLNSLHTNLGDVLAQALSQTKEKKKPTNGSTANANKKSRKSKKMLPLYSTGMNYNGN